MKRISRAAIAGISATGLLLLFTVVAIRPAIGSAASAQLTPETPGATYIVPPGGSGPACPMAPDLHPGVPAGPPGDVSIPHCVATGGQSSTSSARSTGSEVRQAYATRPSSTGAQGAPCCGHLFSGTYTANTGYEEVESDIEVVPVSVPSGDFASAWVMADYDANNYDQAGWEEGTALCPNTPSSANTPTVWTEYNINGSYVNQCYSNYYLAQGTEYYFAVSGQGDLWGTFIYYNNTWQQLNAYYLNAAFTPNTDAPEQFVELYNPGGLPWATFASNWSFDGSALYLTNGNGYYWQNQFPTDANDSAYQLGDWEAFNTYYSDWYTTSSASPGFSISASPSSISVLPGGTYNSTITVSTNSAYDSFVDGGFNLYVGTPPSGDTASISPSYVAPMANSSSYATLTVTIGLLDVGSFTEPVTACGYGGCQTTYVSFNNV